MNPSAKVFSLDELTFISKLVKKFDAYAICDEVYEHLVYDTREHIPLMTLPGMRDRCIRISSAGKTFSMTGWKVGYSVASPKLLAAAAKAHQFLTFATPPNLQKAVAFGLNKDASYFKSISASMVLKRNRLADGLKNIGFDVMESQGTYFLAADYCPLGFKGDDVQFCIHLTKEAGVSAVPFSAFYQGNEINKCIRFCYCKDDNLLDAAVEKLTAFLSKG